MSHLSIFMSQVIITWPRSLWRELQTWPYAAWTWWSSFEQNTCGCISAVSWRRCSAHGHASPPIADTAPLSGKSNTHTQQHKPKSNSIYFLQVTHLALYCSSVCYWVSSPYWLPADTSRSWLDRVCGAWWHSFLHLQVEDPSGKAGIYTCAHKHKCKMTINHEFWGKCQQESVKLQHAS